MNNCTKCGHQLNEGAKFCPECGATVSVNRPAYCKKCGNALSTQVKFCDQCGENISSNPPPQTYQPPPQQTQYPVKKAGMFTALGKYAVFTGRSTRKEYWLFQLFQFIVYVFTFIAVNCLVEGILRIHHSGEPGIVFVSLLSLVFLLPSLAVTVRRLQDTGNSGWLVLLAFVPILGAFTLLVFMLKPSEKHDNQYGPFPG